jgi:cell filamentation protein
MNTISKPVSPISGEERTRRKAASDYARRSVGYEGFTISDEVAEISRRFIAGEITGDEHVAAILAYIALPMDDDSNSIVQKREGSLTYARIAELQLNPVKGNFDAAHLKEVHRRIFQDLPHHAPGVYRPDTPGHSKIRAIEGAGYRYRIFYARGSELNAGVPKILSALNGPDNLRGLNVEQFAERMAKLYGDLDYLHPFQEGNSRTLRAFTTQLAHVAGHELDWSMPGKDMQSRDRLYIARDQEVIQRVFPGLDEARAMTTDSRLEYETYIRFVARFQKADTLQTIIKESVS